MGVTWSRGGHDWRRLHRGGRLGRQNRLRQERDFFRDLSINRYILGWDGRSAQGVEDGRTLDSQRGLLVARQLGNRRLVEPSSCVDVGHVDNVVNLVWLGGRRVNLFVLACWRKQQTAVRCEGQAAEEGGECFVRIHWCAASGHVQATTNAG